MTGFDETVPPEPDPSTDATSVDPGDGTGDADPFERNVVAPEGGPESIDADGEDAPAMAGDDDLASGHIGE